MKKYNFDVKLIKTRLKELRKSKKITQSKLAEEIYRATDTGRTAVTNWENTNCQTLPDIQTLMDICNVLNCDLDYLVGGSEIESQDFQTMSDALHISKESINTLTDNSDYGSFLDNIINNKPELFTNHQNAVNNS